MSPISNPALVPPGNLGPAAPATAPAGAPQRRAAGQDTAQTAPGASTPAPSFADALDRVNRVAQAGNGRLQFSKHALARVQRRGIELAPSTLGRLSQGVDRAASKGSRDSLVLVDGTAFVVSVSNRTVITAVGSEHMKDNVFTNIDSAVIA
jgi:flagellar operon protein